VGACHACPRVVSFGMPYVLLNALKADNIVQWVLAMHALVLSHLGGPSSPI
jgi:hypothetical protein